MDRLTGEDQRMLWSDEIWPQEIGALAVLDGGLHRRTTSPCAQHGCRRLRDCRPARWRESRSLPVGQGVRDIASGLIAVILLAARMPHVLGWFELAASTIPIGDAIIVLRSNGPKATVYGAHGATAVVLLATAALLFT